MVSISTDTTVRPHEVVEDVWFGDEGNEWQEDAYVFTAPPAPDLLSSYLIEDEEDQITNTIRAKARWLEEGFGPEVWAEVQARIKNPKDPLRTAHLFEMYNALMSEVTKRPPTSPSGSSRTPSRTTGAAKRKQQAGTSGD